VEDRAGKCDSSVRYAIMLLMRSKLGRHSCTKHAGVGTATAGSGTNEEWEKQDPGNLSDVVGST
jgi:hypothetical protein